MELELALAEDEAGLHLVAGTLQAGVPVGPGQCGRVLEQQPPANTELHSLSYLWGREEKSGPQGFGTQRQDLELMILRMLFPIQWGEGARCWWQAPRYLIQPCSCHCIVGVSIIPAKMSRWRWLPRRHHSLPLPVLSRGPRHSWGRGSAGQPGPAARLTTSCLLSTQHTALADSDLLRNWTEELCLVTHKPAS